MQEKYQLSEEETKRAEGTMTKKQKELSEVREESQKILNAMGLKGYLERSNERGQMGMGGWNNDILKGEINGHKIEVSRGTERRGTIDGINMSHSDVDKFWEKFSEIFRFMPAAGKEREAMEEINAHDKRVRLDASLKEIGL